MNKLITTFDGGFNLKMDDFRFMELGISEALKALVTPYLGTDSSLILNGIENAPGFISAKKSAGYIYFDGEIYFCPAKNAGFIVSGNAWFFRIKTSFDPSGLKQFKDGLSHDVYAIRQLELLYVNPSFAPVDTFPLPTDRLTDKIYSILLHQMKGPDVVNNQNIGIGPYAGVYQAIARKDLSGSIHLHGSVWNGSPAPTTLFNLPAIYRPVTIKQYMCISSSNIIAYLAIFPNGDVALTGSSAAYPGSDCVIVLDGISFV